MGASHVTSALATRFPFWTVFLLGVLFSLPEAFTADNASLSSGRHGRAKDDGVCELEISCKGDDARTQGGATVRLPIRGQRGPAGPPGERGQRGQDGLSAVQSPPG